MPPMREDGERDTPHSPLGNAHVQVAEVGVERGEPMLVSALLHASRERGREGAVHIARARAWTAMQQVYAIGMCTPARQQHTGRGHRVATSPLARRAVQRHPYSTNLRKG